MPVQQLIPDIQDREFTSGSGHWAGVITWHPETYDGHTGFIEIPLQPSEPQLTIQLNYPNVIPEQLMGVTATLKASFAPGTGFHPVPVAYLTDGNYSFVYTFSGTEPGTSWEIYQAAEALPADWNNAAARITVTPQGFPGDDTPVYLDDFSITTEITVTKVDHLPLMGIH
jgi:hypothetical protein